MIPALLILAALVNLAPAYLSALFGGSEAAWAYVTYGTEAAALWAVVLNHARGMPMRFVAAWGLFEASERPVCRLAFPMYHAPDIGDKGLCDAATGLPMSLIGLIFALFVAAVVQECNRGP